MEEFDTSNLAWIFYKLFYGIDKDVAENKIRNYVEIDFGNRTIDMSGDTDYNFGMGWSHSIREKYENYLEKVPSEYEKLYNTRLGRCVKLYKSVLNISLMPQTGNLQSIEKGIGNDRLDTFIWALDSYYMDETSLLFNNSSFNNTSYLKEYLDLFRTENREETIYNYCYKIYGIESHELVDELIMHGKEAIDSPEKVIAWETEVAEFKEAGKDYDKNKIGQYFSAISNEANLKGLQHGWLVFGVRNKNKEIVGSDYRNTKGLDTLKQEISVGTTGGISFIEIYEVYPEVRGEKKRVILFQIPAATTATPTGWNDHFYGRNGESLGALSVEELDRIRGQEKKDWSKQIIPEAKIEYLDKEAVALARENYKKKMNKPYISDEVNQMTDEQFLTKLKLIINGKITNAAMLLLGREDYDYLFNTVPEASWRVFDSRNEISDYEIFKIPYITLSERLFGKIRNLTYRYMPNQLTLFPTETKQYDMWLLRELLNNCIAHSEYTLGGRIYLNEFEDKIILTNPGSFLPGKIEKVLDPGYNPPFYRNQLLAETMVKLNMIDSQSIGIRRVFRIQRDRYFPLPDYDLSNRQQVKVCVYGKVLDENYSQILFANPDFDLETVFLIDCVQKRIKIDKEAIKHLRKLKVIEGKSPNIFLSASVSETIGEQSQYVKNKAFNDQYYRDLIVKYLEQYGSAKKRDVRELLWDKLPEVMDDKQKESKVKNLLAQMRRTGIITTDSENQQKSSWILVKDLNK